MTVGVLSAPVAIAVADETESKTTDPTAGTQQYRELVEQRVQSHRAAVRAERRENKAERKAKARKRAKKLAKKRAAAQAPVAAAPAASAPQSAGGSTASAGLEGIAACESGGNPGAVSPDGQYRGKYQFDQQTWQSVGGSGDPAAAPEAEQDARAAQLHAQTGGAAWPNC
jgi:hypothetical protein